MMAADARGATTAATPSAAAARQSPRRTCPSVPAKPRATNPFPLPARHRNTARFSGEYPSPPSLSTLPEGDSGQNFPHDAVGDERGHVRRGHGRRDYLDDLGTHEVERLGDAPARPEQV